MAARCSASGCENGRSSAVSLHYYPNDPYLRRLWAGAVDRPNWTPKKRSLLCSDHFAADCYERSPILQNEFGLSTKYAKLKSGSVPTIFKRKRPADTERDPPLSHGKQARIDQVRHLSQSDLSPKELATFNL